MSLQEVWQKWRVKCVIERWITDIPRLEDVEFLFKCARCSCPTYQQEELYLPLDHPGINWPSEVRIAMIGNYEAYHRFAQQAYLENRSICELANIPFTKEFWVKQYLFALYMETAKKGGYFGINLAVRCECVVERVLKQLDQARSPAVAGH